jgi:MFS family permease
MAIWGMGVMLGPILGPTLGGVLTDAYSWRWVFYINVPFGIASAAVLFISLHERIEKHRHALDLGGAALFTVACVALLLGAHGHELAAVGLPIALVGFILFFLVERRSPEPILPLDLFTRRVMWVASVSGALVGATMMASVTYIPLFVQGVLGRSPTEAGATLTPIVLGWPIASAIGSRLSLKTGFRALVCWGMALVAAASVFLAWALARGSGLALPRIAMALMGAGMGFANIALLLAIQTSVEWRQRGIATASTMFFRIMGGAIAIGILGALLASSLSGVSAPPGAANELLGPQHGSRLAPEVYRSLSGVLRGSLVLNFWLIAAISVAAFAVSIFFPSVHVPREAPEASEAAEA